MIAQFTDIYTALGGDELNELCNLEHIQGSINANTFLLDNLMSKHHLITIKDISSNLSLLTR